MLIRLRFYSKCRLEWLQLGTQRSYLSLTKGYFERLRFRSLRRWGRRRSETIITLFDIVNIRMEVWLTTSLPMK